jgi:hypothetical protein
MADKDSKLTQNDLQNTFEYRDGHLFWKTTGKKAGWTESHNYDFVGFKGSQYKKHRLIFLFHHGHLPKYVDHIDNNRQNNRIENLREATASQNSWNQRKRVTNTSGIKGVGWNKKANAWGARCMINYKSHFLGRFKCIEDAENAIKLFRQQHHGEFARH